MKQKKDIIWLLMVTIFSYFLFTYQYLEHRVVAYILGALMIFVVVFLFYFISSLKFFLSFFITCLLVRSFYILDIFDGFKIDIFMIFLILFIILMGALAYTNKGIFSQHTTLLAGVVSGLGFSLFIWFNSLFMVSL